MDVHAPHEPVHSWRDFGIHLAIVTIGLCIALMLEALVEHVHHVHLLREARANIREEIEVDHQAAQKDLVLLQQNIDRQKANIQAIHRLQENPGAFHGSVTNTMDYDSLDEAAWRTARDTGALSLMPYAEVQRYSEIYELAEMVDRNAIDTAQADFLAAAPFEMGVDMGHFSADQYSQLLRDNAAIEIRLLTLKQIVQQLDALYTSELKH